ncbi:MAG TPA: GTP cyclohydrolase I FolE [Chitinophagaceae bacterium]|nr:GTP cyclohydrolase I FolE [Chitinophagaceae bacterium]
MSYKKVEEYCDDELERMAKNNKEILKLIGEDPDREGLAKTPVRVAKALQFMTQGYKMNAKKILDSARFKESVSEMVIVKDIELYSMCEHHMLPFYGKIHIAYIPDGKVFGISKLVRLVEKYSRRMQIQERLTKEIAGEIMEMGVKGVLVIIEGEHLCMKMRGVRNDSVIMTLAHRGVMENKEIRENALVLLYDTKAKLRSV